MKKLINGYIAVLVLALVMVIGSCEQKDEFIDPNARMSIVNSNIYLPDKLEVKNLGSGQKFVFWPGDAGHKYNLRLSGNNYGLSPNAGNDFIYYYPAPGTYTLVMIASSYDAETDRFVQKIDSAQIIVNGNAINNFTSFGIKNAYTNYSPLGEIRNDSILIKVVNVLYPSKPDSLMAFIINRSIPLFSVAENMEYLTVKDENNNIYQGVGTDLTPLQIFNIGDTTTFSPNVRTFTIMDNLTQNAHSYKVAAMFYPELYSLSFDGNSAILFSLDGINVDPNVPYKKDAQGRYVIDNEGKKVLDIYGYYHMHADSLYTGVFLSTDPTQVVPAFQVAPDCNVTLNGVEIISGVSQVDLTDQPVIFHINREYGGFKIITKVAINCTVF